MPSRTKAEAQKIGEQIAKRLNITWPGNWTVVAWDNLGWHVKVILGREGIEVRPWGYGKAAKGHEYSATIDAGYIEHAAGKYAVQFPGNGRTPQAALRAAGRKSLKLFTTLLRLPDFQQNGPI